MTRDVLIKKGILTVTTYYNNMYEDNAQRIEYEHKLIRLGIDVRTAPRSEGKPSKSYSLVEKLAREQKYRDNEIN